MPYPSVRFAVIGDPHFFSSALGEWDFEAAQRDSPSNDIKLLGDSSEILDAALEEICQQDADFLLIAGDLTKDGERESHQELAAKLQNVQAKGTRVFVINGNHDINNRNARGFAEGRAFRTPTITPEEFLTLYDEMGYKKALRRDPHSLSYAAEAAPGLWVLALDSCRYRPLALVSGRIRAKTRQWIQKTLAEAREQGAAVIGLMHHGCLEHYPGNAKYYPEYIIKDHALTSRLLAAGGVPIVFTGHFHAQDTALQTFDDGSFLYDVETGSLVTYPCPYRLVDIQQDQTMQIRSQQVTATRSHPSGFRDYIFEYCYRLGIRLAREHLTKLRVPAADADKLAPQIIHAFYAHVTGNDQRPQSVLDVAGMSWWARFVISRREQLLAGLWHDKGPPDNDLEIDLHEGSWRELPELRAETRK